MRLISCSVLCCFLGLVGHVLQIAFAVVLVWANRRRNGGVSTKAAAVPPSSASTSSLLDEDFLMELGGRTTSADTNTSSGNAMLHNVVAEQVAPSYHDDDDDDVDDDDDHDIVGRPSLLRLDSERSEDSGCTRMLGDGGTSAAGLNWGVYVIGVQWLGACVHVHVHVRAVRRSFGTQAM